MHPLLPNQQGLWRVYTSVHRQGILRIKRMIEGINDSAEATGPQEIIAHTLNAVHSDILYLLTGILVAG